jgi:hypothetical protein
MIKFSVKYRDKLTTHKITTQPNELASTLLAQVEAIRLRRYKPTDLTTRCSWLL